MPLISITAELRNVLVPLDGSNYTAWKVQCRMALIKKDVWDIVKGTEPVPERTNTTKYNYNVKKNRAFAVIVLAVECGSEVILFARKARGSTGGLKETC